ncbi:MAG TPA: hypothetical protein VGX91_11935 [Candidatus Cybelea sp.]|nr:hypothetical protein [Candidatus Cybelea sp.]
MVAMILVGIAVGVSSFGIVRAERAVPENSATYDCSTGTACVVGSSTGSKTWGLYGVSKSADGVHGRTNSIDGNSAVAGVAMGGSGSGNGVYGSSTNGDGVRGVSRGGSINASGVYGSGGIGVTGSSSLASGVYGDGETFGIFGYSKGYTGVIAQSDGGLGSESPALLVQGLNSKVWLFLAENTFADSYCDIDNDGNLECSGKIGADSLRERHRTSTGQHVYSYAAQSASATIEDVGTARMSAGVANVRIDPALASVMDGKWYYVFLTPLGDTRGLYVSMKSANGFQVRETEHGRGSLEFDYRIVAHPVDAGNERLAAASSVHVPLKVMHPR